jgi:hypothetical protein
MQAIKKIIIMQNIDEMLLDTLQVVYAALFVEFPIPLIIGIAGPHPI